MRKKNHTVLITILAVFLLFFLVLPLRGKLELLARRAIGNSSVLSDSGKKTNKFLHVFSTIASLRQQNNDLSQKITNMEVDRSKIIELEYENNLLKKELGFIESHADQILVPAKIIEREPITFLDYVVVDKGKNDGIVAGEAVISGGVLIGQVKDVYDNQSKIVLVTSKDSLVQAMLQNSRSKGILRGGISGLILENLIQDTEFSPGEYIVTSGLGGNLSQGILIGKARETQSYSSGIYKNVYVEPIADLGKLELVFMVK